MQYSIEIPKPCHESWEDMTPEDQGRHCAQCRKTVVDFSGWSNEDILQYMQQRQGQRVCGRFRAEQVNVPIDAEQFVASVAVARLPLYKKIAAILLLAFGMIQMSCDTATHPMQQMTGITIATTGEPVLMGKPAIPDTPKAQHFTDTVKKHQKIKHPVKEYPRPEYLKGDVAVEPVFAEPPPSPDTIPAPEIIVGKVVTSPQDTTKK